MRETARTIGAAACASAAAAIDAASVVISAVTAASAYDVAQEAARHLARASFFLDINSVSPDTKRDDAAAVAPSGAHYVEAAVMAPVAPHGLAVPMLLGGAEFAALAAILAPAGMRMEPVASAIGEASAIKMCRSVMIKGIEALAVECFVTARRYGVEDRIVASLNETFAPLDWEKLAGYLIERVVRHGRRRAAEMREAAETVACRRARAADDERHRRAPGLGRGSGRRSAGPRHAPPRASGAQSPTRCWRGSRRRRRRRIRPSSIGSGGGLLPEAQRQVDDDFGPRCRVRFRCGFCRHAARRPASPSAAPIRCRSSW